MKKQFRLRQAEDYARLRREGRDYRHPFFILSLAPNTLGYNRYGFITVKRLGKAVVRNRARRVLRESIRLLHPRLNPGFDFVVVGRPAMLGQSQTAIQDALQELMRRARLIMNEDHTP